MYQMVTHLKKKKRKQTCPAQEPPLTKKQAGNFNEKDTYSSALEPVVNHPVAACRHATVLTMLLLTCR
jgi:hypothetical protein